MRRIVAVAALAVATLASRALAAEEIKTPWSGFGVGSFVHHRSTSKMSGIAGMPDTPNVSETKQTLTKITDDAYFVRTEAKNGETWIEAGEFPWPRKGSTGPIVDPTAKIENLGDETLSVDGTSIACKKQKVSLGESVTISWTSDKHGVVKSETAAPGVSSTIELTKLAAKTKIGDAAIEYRETVMTSKATGASTKMTTWTSDAVPGGQVRSESSTELPGGMTTSIVTETIAFEKK